MFESGPKKENTDAIPEFSQIATPVPEYQVEDSKEDFSKWLKSVGFAAALSLISPAEAATTDKEKHELTPEQEKIVGEVLGTELMNKYRANGFEFTVPLEADASGSYVVHIGQVHESPTGGISGMLTAGIVKDFQGTLREALKETAEKGGGVVFAEGISASAEHLSKVKEDVLTFKTGLEEIAAKEDMTLATAMRSVEYVSVYQKNNNNALVRNSIPTEVIKKVSDKLEKFVEEYEPQSTDEEAQLAVIETTLAIGGFGEVLDAFEGKKDFMSAALSLYMENAINLGATEDKDLNAKAVAKVKEVEAEKYAVSAERRKALDSDTELQAIEAELEPLIERFRQNIQTAEDEQRVREVYDLRKERRDDIKAQFGQKLETLKNQFAQLQKERDMVVFEKVEEYEQLYGKVPHAVVVYGAAHEFGEELEEFNEHNGDGIDRGLIEIKQPK